MQESADLKDFIIRRYQELGHEKAWSREDGVLLISTDPMEWTEGYEDFVASRRAIAESGDEDASFSLVGDLRAFSEGTIGWVASHAKWTLEEGTEIPARMTVVCRKEGDEWACVQAHFSIGIPNKEVFG